MITTKEIYVDGASSGNPGKSRIAVYSDDFNLRIVKDVGEGTNNRAEYLALIYALTYAKHIKEPVTIKSDSQLVVNQINGNYKVNAGHLFPLYRLAKEQLKQLNGNVQVVFIHREENIADSLFH